MRALTIALVAGLLPAATFTAPVVAQDFSADAVYRLQQLQEEMRQLRGLVEQQQRELERLRQRQRDQYLDLDARIQAATSGQLNSTSGYNDAGQYAQNNLPAGDGYPANNAAAGNTNGIDPNALVPAANRGNNPLPSGNTANRSGGPSVLPQATTPAASSTPPSNANEYTEADIAALGEPEVRAPVNAQTTVNTIARPEVRAGGAASVSATEQSMYDNAFNELKALRYERAADGFRDFIQQYPGSRLADNAQYWLGESYYGARNFTMALQAFQQLLERYPDSGKRADAMLKVGYSHYELRQWPAARAALEQVQQEHPGTTIARLAENRLRTMRLEGHF